MAFSHSIPTSRPVLPWAVVFLAAVLALQLAHLHQAQRPGQGPRTPPGRGGVSLAR